VVWSLHTGALPAWARWFSRSEEQDELVGDASVHPLDLFLGNDEGKRGAAVHCRKQRGYDGELVRKKVSLVYNGRWCTCHFSAAVAALTLYAFLDFRYLCFSNSFVSPEMGKGGGEAL